MADDIEAQLAAQFEDMKASGEFDDALNDFMANDVVPVWKGYAPEDTGAYVESIEVTQPAESGKGEVAATDEAANVIEYGSIDTPEHPARAKTIEHFAQ